MQRLGLVFSMLIIVALSAKAQETNIRTITWELLKNVRFEEQYDDATGSFFDKPVFPPMIASLEGKKVKISGYVIPMDVDLNEYVVSAFPFSSCFFCGGAGPESVVDIQLKDKKLNFKNDQRETFCGTLRLNQGQYFQLPFILKEAELCDQ